MIEIEEKIKISSEKLNSHLLSIEEILKELQSTLNVIFNKSTINIYLLNNETKKIESTSTNNKLWNFIFQYFLVYI